MHAGPKQDDPNAPRPVGPSSQPAVGVPLESRQEWYGSLDEAISHHNTALAKQPAVSVVDPHGKVSVALTYSKFCMRVFVLLPVPLLYTCTCTCRC